SLPSFCLGSAVLVNLAGAISGKDISSRRAQLISALAHEYAHTWWSFSAVWDNLQTNVVINEALAVVLDWDIQAMIGGAHAIRWNRAKLWDYLTNAARRRENSLLRDRETSSGAYAASLLIDLLCRDRMRVID